MNYEHSPQRSSRHLNDEQVLSTGKGKRVVTRPNNGSMIEGFDSFNNSALSNERIRMTAVNTQDSTYHVNYGNRSNISEINEADFSANLKSDYSVSSPQAAAGNALPSIHQQMLSSENVTVNNNGARQVINVGAPGVQDQNFSTNS